MPGLVQGPASVPPSVVPLDPELPLEPELPLDPELPLEPLDPLDPLDPEEPLGSDEPPLGAGSFDSWVAPGSVKSSLG